MREHTSMDSIESRVTDHTSLSHENDLMSLVFVGHVDHGKSTVLGRLMADTGSLPEGKLEQVKERCRRNSKPFEYAFLLDALKDEQAQGITIDTARCFFKTPMRDYLILDAPGHIEFLKNMVTGASRAEAALLVIDAEEGIQENSRRHGYLLSMLGIRQVAVVVNKMDLVDWSRDVFDQIERDYGLFLQEIGVKARAFVPASGREGDNVADRSTRMSWYEGATVLELLDTFQTARPPRERPFRMPVQAVYKFTARGDSRRIIAGTVEAGTLRSGDDVVFYPSGKRAQVKSMEAFGNGPALAGISAGQAAGFTLDQQIYVRRGEIAMKAGERPLVTSSRLRTHVFWLGRDSLCMEKEYWLKVCTSKVRARLVSVERVIDASTLEQEKRDAVARHEVAECIFELDRAISFDLAAESQATARFVIVDDYEIRGGGIIIEGLVDQTQTVREKVFMRNYKWERSMIPRESRVRKLGQRAAMVLITGEKDTGKKPLAKELEQRLFEDGRMVYFLGIGNLLYGVDADIKFRSDNFREEHVRRLAEVAHLMLEAGVILIVTAVEVNQQDLRIMSAVLNGAELHTVWVGENITTDLPVDVHIAQKSDTIRSADELVTYLHQQDIIPTEPEA